LGDRGRARRLAAPPCAGSARLHRMGAVPCGVGAGRTARAGARNRASPIPAFAANLFSGCAKADYYLSSPSRYGASEARGRRGERP